jgi:hypothetical protein
MSKQWVSSVVLAGSFLGLLLSSAAAADRLTIDKLSIGIEFNSLNNSVEDTTTISGSARVPFLGTLSAEVTNSIDKIKLTQLLTRIEYQFNDHFTPYVLLGLNGLSFDDKYNAELDTLLGIDTKVPFSGGMSLGYGLGISGLLMELPQKARLTYGVRTFSFSSSDDTSVAPEDISRLLYELNPVEDVNFSTDVSYREWDFDLAVSREFKLDSDYSVTPQLGYHHASVSMDTSTSVEYSPGAPYFVKGSFDRSVDGSLSSITLGVSATYRRAVSASIQLVVGEVSGLTLGGKFSF